MFVWERAGVRGGRAPGAWTRITRHSDCQVPVGQNEPQWNFYKADYNLLYSSLACTDWSPIYNILEPDEFSEWVFYCILDDCVPRKQPKRAHA